MRIDEIKKIIGHKFNKVEHIQAVNDGWIKDVFFFDADNKHYVISFSDHNINRNDKFLHELLAANSTLTNLVIDSGAYQDRYYTIANKIDGKMLKEYDVTRFLYLLDQVMTNITAVHSSDTHQSSGYGWIKDGRGAYTSHKDFFEAAFAEKQDGYWENWYHLFDNTFLDFNDFQGLYKEMMSLIEYVDQKYLVHGDFFLNNILVTKDDEIKLIDWDNAMFSDCLIDVASLQMELPLIRIKESFKNYYQTHDVQVKHFEERFKCMSLFKGLDALRFFSKQGDYTSYVSVLDYLKAL